MCVFPVCECTRITPLRFVRNTSTTPTTRICAVARACLRVSCRGRASTSVRHSMPRLVWPNRAHDSMWRAKSNAFERLRKCKHTSSRNETQPAERTNREGTATELPDSRKLTEAALCASGRTPAPATYFLQFARSSSPAPRSCSCRGQRLVPALKFTEGIPHAAAKAFSFWN